MIYRHPEWKRLYEMVADTVKSGDVLEYPRLQELSGVDIRSHRGRAQFHRFAREMLAKKSIHFEPIANVGYRAVEASEHFDCGLSRVRRARRRLIEAGKIIAGADFAALSPAQAAANADALARIGKHVMALGEDRRDLQRLGGQAERLPRPALEAATKH